MSSVKYLQYRYMFRTCNTAGGGRHAAAPNNAHELFQTQTFSPAPDKEGTAPGAVGVRSASGRRCQRQQHRPSRQARPTRA